MIVATRFKDVDWKEAERCCAVNDRDEAKVYWNKHRGQPVHIEVPSNTAVAGSKFLCEGPLYKIVDLADVGRCWYVCPHIAEIGD